MRTIHQYLTQPYISYFDFSSDETWLILLGNNLILSSLENTSMQITKPIENYDNASCYFTSIDGVNIALGFDNGLVSLYHREADSIQKIDQVNCHSPITQIIGSHDYATFYIGTEFGGIFKWQPNSDLEPEQFIGHNDKITDLFIDSETAHLISTSYDGSIQFWDLLTGEKKQQVYIPNQEG